MADRRDCRATGLKQCSSGLARLRSLLGGVFRVDALLERFPLDEPEDESTDAPGDSPARIMPLRHDCTWLHRQGSRVLLDDSAHHGGESVAQDSIIGLSKVLEFATITACRGWCRIRQVRLPRCTYSACQCCLICVIYDAIPPIEMGDGPRGAGSSGVQAPKGSVISQSFDDSVTSEAGIRLALIALTKLQPRGHSQNEAGCARVQEDRLRVAGSIDAPRSFWGLGMFGCKC